MRVARSLMGPHFDTLVWLLRGQRTQGTAVNSTRSWFSIWWSSSDLDGLVALQIGNPLLLAHDCLTTNVQTKIEIKLSRFARGKFGDPAKFAFNAAVQRETSGRFQTGDITIRLGDRVFPDRQVR